MNTFLFSSLRCRNIRLLTPPIKTFKESVCVLPSLFDILIVIFLDGKCLDVCPGSLIVRGEDKKAVIRYPKDCWGCASCIKECPFEAISYYLGADIGGMGSQMTVHTEGDLLHWRIKKTDGTIETIVVNKKDSNKY